MKYIILLIIILTACAQPRPQACQVIAPVVLQDCPGHNPPENQQYLVEAEEVLPVIEKVWIWELMSNYVKVEYGTTAGYIPLENCRMLEAR